MPCIRAEVNPTDELVAELKAQRQKSSADAASLNKKLEEAYSQLDLTRQQSERAVTAVIVTAIVSGGAVALVLIFFIRGKNKTQHDLLAMNERLDKQWQDLRTANEELAKVNRELSAALASLKKN